MCGIAGYYGKNAESLLGEFGYYQCRQLMKRRGPDNIGEFVDNKCLLLHSRLKVLDFSDEGNQPLFNQNYAIAFNGELYNYVEIREELKKRKEFYTEGDNEVMFNLLSMKGVKGLDDAEGMWAIAFYDRTYKELTFIRDRFGEKPLWIYEKGDGVYFGSEIKYIKALIGDNLKINYDKLISYLSFGYRSLFSFDSVNDCDSFYEGINQLSPGCYTTYGSINSYVINYSDDYMEIGENNNLTYEDCVGTTREKLTKAVQITTGRTDTDVAYLLSGGVDSNAIVSTAKQLGQKIDTFSIVDNGPDYNEKRIIQEAVKFSYNNNHTFVEANKENFLDNLRDIISYHEAPMCTVSYYVHWLLLKEIAKRGYRVVVSGTAGDELFAGYYDHYLYWFYEMRHKTDINESFIGWYRGLRPYIKNTVFRNSTYFNDDNIDSRSYLYPNFSSYFAPDFRRQTNCNKIEFQEYEFYKRNSLRNRMLNELFYETVPPILFEDDLNSSYFSLENRSPLLNKELFEFSCKIPTKYLLNKGYGKAILRDAIKPYAPSCVVDQRKKTGFNASLKELLSSNDLHDFIDQDCELYDIVVFDEIAKLCAKFEDVGLNGDENKFLFSFISSKLFLEECV